MHISPKKVFQAKEAQNYKGISQFPTNDLGDNSE